MMTKARTRTTHSAISTAIDSLAHGQSIDHGGGSRWMKAKVKPSSNRSWKHRWRQRRDPRWGNNGNSMQHRYSPYLLAVCKTTAGLVRMTRGNMSAVVGAPGHEELNGEDQFTLYCEWFPVLVPFSSSPHIVSPLTVIFDEN